MKYQEKLALAKEIMAFLQESQPIEEIPAATARHFNDTITVLKADEEVAQHDGQEGAYIFEVSLDGTPEFLFSVGYTYSSWSCVYVDDTPTIVVPETVQVIQYRVVTE